MVRDLRHQSEIMKRFYRVCAVAVACMAPALCFAQSSQVTRQQVRDELAALESVGYDPFRAAFRDYPGELQAAMSRLHANRNIALSGRDSHDPDRSSAQLN